MKIPAATAILIVLTMLSPSAFAENFLEKCPCGPSSIKGPIRLLFMQGHRGADFRGPCRKHDYCYDTLGMPKTECDDCFLVDLLATCDDSKNPKMARFKAKLAFWLVQNFGNGAYRSAQFHAGEGLLSATK